MPDLPERPGQPSDTRQMVERGRTDVGTEISSRTFFIALGVIGVIVGVIALLLR